MQYNHSWYDNLRKPLYLPPKELFSPVWQILYLLMIVSFIILVSKGFSGKTLICSAIFFLQLLTNLYWPIAFFKEHNLRKAFIISIILTILVGLTILAFTTVSNLSAMLLIPYFLWCSFATVLSYNILKLNS